MEPKKDGHEKIKRGLKIAGFVLLGVGAVLLTVGLVDFFRSFGGYGFPKLFWMAMLGILLVGAGISFLSVGYRREITRYMKNESMPVVNESAEELKPAVKAVANAMRESLVCPHCGEANPVSNRFCAECGKPLFKTCSACGAEVEADDKFCGKCGAKFEE